MKPGRIPPQVIALVAAAHALALGWMGQAAVKPAQGSPRGWLTRTVVEAIPAAPVAAQETPAPAAAAPAPSARPQRRGRAPRVPSTESAAAEEPPAETRRIETEPPDASAPPIPEPAASAPADATATTALAAPQPLPQPAPPAPSPAPALAFEVQIPGSTRLLYDLEGHARNNDYRARGELLWRHDGERYEARMQVSAFLIGQREQTSRGRLSAQGLVPERFGDRSRSELAAHIDAASGRVTFSANTPEAAWVPGMQDRLSVMLQMAARVGANPALYPPGTQITQPTVSAREAEVWTLTVEGVEQLDLPGGQLEALRLVRQPRRPYDQRIEVWLARQLHWLPARIRITQANGDFVDQRWRGSEPVAP